MGLSRQEYRSGLPCPPPGDLPDPGIKLESLTSPALAGRFFTPGNCVLKNFLLYPGFSLVTQLVKNLPAMQETWVRSLGLEDSLENGKTTHSSIQAWKIPWTVQSMELQRVGHD